MLTTYAPWHQVPTLRPDLMSGDGESDSVSEIDPVTMKVLRSADVDGHVDAIAYDPSISQSIP